jgi:signal transduction histidine kinase
MNQVIADIETMQPSLVLSDGTSHSVLAITHDFKNILMAIKGLTYMLSMVADDPRRLAEVVEMLNKATERGNELTRELLNSKPTKMPQNNLTNVVVQVTETVQMLRGSIPERIRLNLKLDQNIPLINVDKGHLNRILTNLIINAVDAIFGEGSITVSAEFVKVHDPSEEFSDQVLCSFLRLQVTDTGEGMNEFVRHRALQAHFTTKGDGKGHGLGLSIVSNLMQSYNGSIDITSTVGKGTEVSLLFPITSAADEQGNDTPNWRQNL